LIEATASKSGTSIEEARQEIMSRLEAYLSAVPVFQKKSLNSSLFSHLIELHSSLDENISSTAAQFRQI